MARLEHACAGRSFAQRRDTAIIAVLRATGIRLAELAGLRYDPQVRASADSETCRAKGLLDAHNESERRKKCHVRG